MSLTNPTDQEAIEAADLMLEAATKLREQDEEIEYLLGVIRLLAAHMLKVEEGYLHEDVDPEERDKARKNIGFLSALLEAVGDDE